MYILTLFGNDASNFYYSQKTARYIDILVGGLLDLNLYTATVLLNVINKGTIFLILFDPEIEYFQTILIENLCKHNNILCNVTYLQLAKLFLGDNFNELIENDDINQTTFQQLI